MNTNIIKREDGRIDIVSIYVFCIAAYFIALPLGAMQFVVLGSALRILGIVPLAAWALFSRNFRPTTLTSWQAILTLWMLFTVFIAYQKTTAMERVNTNFMFWLLLVVAAAGKYTPRQIAFMRGALIWSSRITAFLMLYYGSFMRGRLYLSGAIREDPNYLNGYLVFGAVNAVICVFQRRSILIKCWFVVEFGIYMFLSFYTGSRSGLLMLLLATGLTVLFYKNPNNKNIVATFIAKVVIIFLAIVAVIIASQFMSENILDRFTIENVVDSGASGRADILQDAMKLYTQSEPWRQVVGVGAGNIRAAFKANGYISRVVHNIYVEIMIEDGIIGITIYIITQLTFLFTAMRRKDLFCWTIMIGFMFMSAAGSLYAFKPYWNIMIMIVCITKMKDAKTDGLLSYDEYAGRARAAKSL